MDMQLLNKMFNNLSYLSELIRDTLPMIERESEARKHKDILASP
jgi:hypothetical protein